jgi:hypothetical protein
MTSFHAAGLAYHIALERAYTIGWYRLQYTYTCSASCVFSRSYRLHLHAPHALLCTSCSLSPYTYHLALLALHVGTPHQLHFTSTFTSIHHYAYITLNGQVANCVSVGGANFI